MVGELDKSEFKPDTNYNEFYAGHQFEPFPEDLALTADQVIPRVAWALDIAREIGAGNVLDLCCLDGFASLTLSSKLGITAIGVDLSKPGIKLANKRAQANHLEACYWEESIEEMPSRGTYDLVILFEAIEHFKDVDQIMLVIKRHLRPGGTLLISTPDAEGRFGIENTEDICHLRVYTTHDDIMTLDKEQRAETPKPIVSLPSYLRDQGFTIVENEVYNELIHVRATL